MKPQEFRERIIDYINLHKIEKTEIARKTGISRQTVYAILGGSQRMHLEFYLAFCEAIHVNPCYFFLDDHEAQGSMKMKDDVVELVKKNERLERIQQDLIEELLEMRKQHPSTR